MKSLMCIILSLLFIGCASLPEGEKQLKEMIAQDRTSVDQILIPVDKGRPIFVKSWVYPQIYPSGDIRQGSEIYVYVGREKVSFEDLLKEPTK